MTEHGAGGVAVLDVSEKAPFANVLIVCTGMSEKHVRAIACGVRDDMRALDVRVDGDVVHAGGEGGWMLVDLGSVVVHVMTEEIRDLYRIEELWVPDSVVGEDAEEVGEGEGDGGLRV